MLDVGDAEFHRAVKDLGNEGRDALFDRLVALRIPDRVTTMTLMYPKPYEPLLRALDATGEQQTRLIERFLAVDDDGMWSAYWHDRHLSDDSGYFGYWCFELAAFVRELRIDDATFADSAFYPRDLVTGRTTVERSISGAGDVPEVTGRVPDDLAAVTRACGVPELGHWSLTWAFMRLARIR